MNPPLSRLVRRGLTLLGLLAAIAAVTLHAAAPGQPVTIKELCLMLRGGYTGDEVLRETSGRPLLEPLDANAETALRAAGADARLIAALKTTHPALSADQAAAAKQRQADIDERNLQSQEAQRANLLAFHKQAAEQHQTALRQMSFGKLAEQLRDQLVSLTPNGLQPYDNAALGDKKLFAFYFASMTDPQCRKFTPQLLQFYRDFAPKHPMFEVVFVSEDRSGYNMENHMRQDAMPWPALSFDRLASQPGLAALGKEGIPRLTVLDGSGRTVSDSFANGQYVGPQHVLDDLAHLGDAANAAPPPAAAAPAAPIPAPVAGAPAGSASPDHMASVLRGKLVRYANGGLQSYDDSKLAGKKYFGLYYSAHWCGPCRQFTPQLVNFYKQMAATHPNFEIILVSDDHSADEMQNYMKVEDMPWAAVRFEQLKQEKELTHYCGSGIPDLVVVDGSGQVVADSYQGQKYIGPEPVMAYLGELLAGRGG